MLTKQEQSNSNFGSSFYNDKLTIYVIDNDEDIVPHFHIIDTETDGIILHTRILFNKPQYFSEGETKLSKRQIKSLINHLSKINKRSFPLNLTNWELNCWYWNRFNKNKVKTKKIADYTKLNGD